MGAARREYEGSPRHQPHHRITDRLRGDAVLADLLAHCEQVLLPDRETAGHYARLFVQLKRAGTPMPDNDVWIAALVLQHDLRLITRDRHFSRIPQLLLG